MAASHGCVLKLTGRKIITEEKDKVLNNVKCQCSLTRTQVNVQCDAGINKNEKRGLLTRIPLTSHSLSQRKEWKGILVYLVLVCDLFAVWDHHFCILMIQSHFEIPFYSHTVT